MKTTGRKPCANCNGSHQPTCVTRAYETFLYLADGTKVVVRRGPKVKGPVWLEVVPQEIILAQKDNSRAKLKVLKKEPEFKRLYKEAARLAAKIPGFPSKDKILIKE